MKVQSLLYPEYEDDEETSYIDMIDETEEEIDDWEAFKREELASEN